MNIHFFCKPTGLSIPALQSNIKELKLSPEILRAIPNLDAVASSNSACAASTSASVMVLI